MAWRGHRLDGNAVLLRRGEHLLRLSGVYGGGFLRRGVHEQVCVIVSARPARAGRASRVAIYSLIIYRHWLVCCKYDTAIRTEVQPYSSTLLVNGCILHMRANNGYIISPEKRQLRGIVRT